ncbi:MAG: SusC/RagA family TonB-linked outer membrane protein, partial [Bacteroidales bacterium]|nr:SusC/RagA family TonB-linked outer membrane protein [Bacteroidales bacterium]
EGLRVDASFNYDISTSKNKVWSIPYFYHEYNVNTGEYDYKQGTGQSTVTLTDTYNYGTNMLYNYRITYDRYFGDHRVALMVGQEQQINQSSSAMARRQNFISTAIEEINVGSTAAEDKDNSGSSSKTARNNYFGRFNYEYASKYLLELLFRYDGSYKFPKDKRYGFFPAASFGWRISEEPFIKDNAPWINQLKLRASLGQTGNDAVSAYQYMQNYSFGGNFIFGTSTSAGIQPGTMPNPNITWERSTKYDLGLETTLWNGLLGAEITVFKEKRNNILTARNLSIPSTFGFSSLPNENIGKIENHGYEIVLSHRNRIGELSYNVSGNMSYAKNTIIFMDETPNVEEYQNRTGHPIGAGLYYKADGIFHTQEELDSYPHHSRTHVGDPKIIDLNNDGKIDSNDRFRFDYDATPRYVFGLNFGVNYKNFDLSMLIQGQAGAYNYDDEYVKLGASDYSNSTVHRSINRWTVDNPNGTMPRADCYQPGSSTFFLHNASFVRLKNIEFGYTIPKSVMSRIGFNSCRFYVSGFNVLTWAKEVKWSDPEVSGNYLSYPQQRVLNLGARIQF